MAVNKRLISIVTIVAALLAIAVPIVVALRAASLQGMEVETDRVLVYARDVLNRTENTAAQVDAGIQRLIALHSADRCSDEAIAVMRHIDLGSSYIQAIGVMEGDRMVCSSLGRDPLEMGPVDLVTSKGVNIRNNVEFPFTPGQTFIVIGRDNYAAIIHKDLPIDTTTQEAQVTLATFTFDNKAYVTSRGFVKQEWIERLGNGYETTFLDGNHLVAVTRSQQFLSGAVAALPVTYLNARVRALALILIPIGLVAGGILAYAVSYLSRVQTAMPAIIKFALRHDEFFLAYQPIVELKTGRWVGAEALIRWRRPNGEMIRPDMFIPVAEETGLILQITQRVLEIIMRDAAEFLRSHPHFHIAVNLSSADLGTQATIDNLGRMITAAGIAPKNLMVEATERGFMEGEAAKRTMKSLRAMGISVAIDDFGTGYSSLSYLEKFDLDFLKIDKSFVDTVGTEAATSQVVQHIIEMAKSLKLEMIAEGVEKESQANFLRERGVQFAQGWHFGKPMPFGELTAKLERAAETPQPV